MKKNKLKHFDLDLYSEILDNGLEINIVPKKTVNNIYVTFSTKYGSIHDEFIPIEGDTYYKVPMGVAHFLEHKVFEQADGVDSFTVFSKYGADANANTSNYKTTYLFSGPTYFEENINFLLDFVQAPYFTEENVEKEKGIIAQELKMLMDDPNWQLYDKTLYNSFINHPIRYPIGGTLESINKITKEDLYTCYNTFYHPANMFITITGNVEPKKAIAIIKKNQAQKTFAPFKPIVLKEYAEPDEVKKEYEEMTFDVSIPKISIAFKINKLDYDINRLRIYLNLYFSLIIGSTSLLAEKLRLNNFISNSIDYDVINTDKHLLYMVDCESYHYQEVIEELLKVIGKVRVTENDIKRKQKSLKSGCIYRSDNIYGINNRLNNDLIHYKKIKLDEFSIIHSLNLVELNDILDHVSFDKRSIVVIKNS